MALRFGYSLKALGGNLGGQWERTRRDTLFLMGAVLLSAIPQFGFQPAWVSASFLLLFFWRLGLVMTGRGAPGTVVRLLAAVGCAAGVYAEYHSLIGRDPGISLLVLFLGLKLIEMQARRDLFVVIFLCFFLLLTTFFHSQSMLAAAMVVAAVFALVTAMLTIQFAENEVAIGRRMRMTAKMLLQAAPLALVLFLVFPRLSTPMWGAQGLAGAARTGLSETMSPGSIAELSQSDEVAFRVHFDTPPARPAMYWRGPVLDHFDGRAWSTSSVLPYPSVPASVEVSAGAPRYRYAVTLEPTGQRWLFALEAPIDIDPRWASRSSVDDAFTLMARDEIGQRIRYEMVSSTDYRLGADETPSSLRNWLQLPPGGSPRTLAMARQWRAEGLPPATLVERALRMFAEQPFRYTLRPPLLDREPVDGFLFDTRAGFCEHFSSAFVVLMRALDIPARVVTGYQGGERNSLDDYWIVRQSDAHAWAEVWLAGRGWLRVDPTAAVAPERIERGAPRNLGAIADRFDAGNESSFWHGVSLRIDAITHGWNQWVLSYDDKRQRGLFGAFGIDFADWRELAGLFAALSMLVIGGCALLTLHPRPSKDPVERAWSEFCDKLAACGVPRERHETAWQFHERSRRLLDAESAAQARRIVALYNELRYGGRGSLADVRHLRQSVARFQP
jgi:transglutaminase-like putative cysteine protease